MNDSPAVPLVELARTPSMLIGSVGSIFVSVWSGESSDEDYDLLDKLEGELIAAHKRIFSLAIVTSIATSASATQIAKKRGVPIMRFYAKEIIGSATVITPTGIAATVARKFTTAFNMVSDVPVHTRVFATISDSVRWLAELDAAQAIDVERVTKQIEKFAQPAETQA